MGQFSRQLLCVTLRVNTSSTAAMPASTAAFGRTTPHTSASQKNRLKQGDIIPGRQHVSKQPTPPACCADRNRKPDSMNAGRKVTNSVNLAGHELTLDRRRDQQASRQGHQQIKRAAAPSNPTEPRNGM